MYLKSKDKSGGTKRKEGYIRLSSEIEVRTVKSQCKNFGSTYNITDWPKGIVVTHLSLMLFSSLSDLICNRKNKFKKQVFSNTQEKFLNKSFAEKAQKHYNFFKSIQISTLSFLIFH